MGGRDRNAAVTLALLNAIVAVLNVMSLAVTNSATDFFATVAWVGSALYWLVRSNY